MKKLYRSEQNRMVAGVCGGLGDHFNIDVSLIRIIWAVLTILGVGSPILIYLIMAFVVPNEGDVN